MELTETIEKIDHLVKTHKIVLFMKGSPEFPQCGFSALAANILNLLNTEYESINVLENQAIREAIKQYKNWPTIPQLYINGEFIGGADIMKEMYETGELQTSIA